MKQSFTNTENLILDTSRDLEIVLSILESGNSVELPATGYSMFPTFSPGNRILIKPVRKGETPPPGTVVVFKDNKVLVMHRLIKIVHPGNAVKQFITRGDCLPGPDLPWTIEQLIGIAVAVKTRGIEKGVKTFLPAEWRYSYNRKLLWLCFKLRIFAACG